MRPSPNGCGRRPFGSSLESIDDLWRVEMARLLPELLTDRPDLPQPGPMTETWQQQRFFQSIVHALQAAPAPLLLHLDDLQWSDEETLTLLQFLLHGAQPHPLLFVGGIRSEDAGGNQALARLRGGNAPQRQLSELYLGAVSADEATELADSDGRRGNRFRPGRCTLTVPARAIRSI